MQVPVFHQDWIAIMVIYILRSLMYQIPWQAWILILVMWQDYIWHIYFLYFVILPHFGSMQLGTIVMKAYWVHSKYHLLPNWQHLICVTEQMHILTKLLLRFMKYSNWFVLHRIFDFYLYHLVLSRYMMKSRSIVQISNNLLSMPGTSRSWR